jgi:hypothetical protein
MSVILPPQPLGFALLACLLVCAKSCALICVCILTRNLSCLPPCFQEIEMNDWNRGLGWRKMME